MKFPKGLCLVLVCGVFACVEPVIVVRHPELTALKQGPIINDGISMQYRVYGISETASHPRLGRTVPATIHKLGFSTQGQVNVALLTAPVFELKITNSTGHVIRSKGAVIKLIDTAGNSYDLRSKDEVLATLEQAIAKAEAGLGGQKVALESSAVATLKSAVASVKILDQNAEILPNFSETYYLSFNIPIEATAAALDEWLQKQSTLTLKIFEFTSQVDGNGDSEKKVTFEFPLEVRTPR